jgi:hypothetical protein
MKQTLLKPNRKRNFSSSLFSPKHNLIAWNADEAIENIIHTWQKNI